MTSASGLGPRETAERSTFPASIRARSFAALTGGGPNAIRSISRARSRKAGHSRVEPSFAQAFDERRVERAPRVAQRPVGPGIGRARSDGQRSLDLRLRERVGGQRPARAGIEVAAFPNPPPCGACRGTAARRSSRGHVVRAVTASLRPGPGGKREERRAAGCRGRADRGSGWRVADPASRASGGPSATTARSRDLVGAARSATERVRGPREMCRLALGQGEGRVDHREGEAADRDLEPGGIPFAGKLALDREKPSSEARRSPAAERRAHRPIRPRDPVATRTSSCSPAVSAVTSQPARLARHRIYALCSQIDAHRIGCLSNQPLESLGEVSPNLTPGRVRVVPEAVRLYGAIRRTKGPALGPHVHQLGSEVHTQVIGLRRVVHRPCTGSGEGS